MPRLFIIAGPNGAGKTTFAQRFLPHYAHCQEFVNADLIASGLSPFAPDAAAFRAGRLMLQQINTLAQQRHDFAFETTLSGKTYLPILRRMKRSSYTITPFFLWLPEVELALSRVAGRVRLGGHSVPESVIRRRFSRGLRNFLGHYRPLLDSWILFDNSLQDPQVLASEENKKLHVANPDLFAKLSKTAGEK